MPKRIFVRGSVRHEDCREVPLQNTSNPQKNIGRVEIVKTQVASQPIRRLIPATFVRFARLGSVPNVGSELRRVRQAWKSYQSTRQPNSVFDYLTAVPDLVGRWQWENRLDQALRRAQINQAGVRTRTNDPYTRLIACTSDPSRTDAKTRSKWARALRSAEANKPEAESLAEFIQRNGGINQCAARWRK